MSLEPTSQAVAQGQKMEYKKLNITDKYPGRLELALVHQAANKFGVPVHQNRKVCACCDAHVYVKQVGCCADLSKVGCDPGITVLFNFIKTVIIFAIFIFLVGSAYNLYTNIVGGQCGNPHVAPLVRCVPHPIFVLSPVNKLLNKQQFHHMQITTLITAILSVLFFIFYRKVHYDCYMVAQELVQNQEEFTLYITNIPVVMDGIGSSDYQTRLQNLLTGEINNWLAKNQLNPGQNPPEIPGQKYVPNFPRIYNRFVEDSRQPFNAPYQDKKIVDVHLCWDIRELTQLQRIKTETKNNIQTWAQNMDEAKEQGNVDQSTMDMIKNVQGNLDKYSNQLRTVNNEYVKLCAEYTNKHNLGYSEHLANFLGKAFVCFQYQHFAQVIRIMMKREDIKMGEHTLRAVWAPSPRDVNWSNLNINPWVRRKKELISLLVLIGAILFSFAIQLGVQIFQTTLGPPNPEQGGAPPKQEMRELQIVATVLGFASSGIVFLINGLLFKTMNQLIIFEKHESITDEQTSLLWKTLVSQFINTTIIFYTFNFIFPAPIWAPQGIVYNASMMLIMINIFQTVAKVLGIGYLIWKIGKWCTLSNGPLEAPVFQDNLNTELELPPFELGQTYLEYLNSIYMAAFFAYVAPWGSLFIAIISTIGYFVDKWHLTRHYSLKTHYSYDMSTEALKIFEFVPFVFVLGQVLFSFMFHGPSWILWLALAITFIYPIVMNNLPAFLYIRLMSTWLRYEKYSYGYCQANHMFDFTYLNSNPLTRFTSSLHNKDDFMTLEEAQQYLQRIPQDQAEPYPKYDPNTMALNKEEQRNKQMQQQQQQQRQQQQPQYQQQSQIVGANRSVYGQSYNQGQTYQLGSQYGNFNYQALPQRGL